MEHRSITDKGKETLANLEGNPETATLLQQAITAKQAPPTKNEPPPEPQPPATPPTPEEQPETVPSQADLFKAEGKEELNRIKKQEVMSLLN
jgi:hypothetical protein